MPRIAALVLIAALALAGARPLHCAMPGAGSDPAGSPTDAAHGHVHGGAHGGGHGSSPDVSDPPAHDHGPDAPAGDGAGLPCSALAPCSATALPTLGLDPDLQRLAAGPSAVFRYAPPALHDLSTEPPPPRLSSLPS